MESHVAVAYETPPVPPERIFAIDRPDPALLWLYVIRSAIWTFGVGFVLAIVPSLIRYYTLRYRFDEHGIAISSGLLFRREAFLTYVRIQDIHLTRTFLERWLGIGTVEIQTASGSSGSTESLVGLREDELVRDFLYQRMRGNEAVAATAAPAAGAHALALLEGIRDELVAARRAVAGTVGASAPAESLRAAGSDAALAPGATGPRAATEGGPT